MKHRWSCALIKNSWNEQNCVIAHFTSEIDRWSDLMRPNNLTAAFLITSLTLLSTLSATGTSRAASFNCDAQNLQPDEKAICDVRALNDADVKMVTTFDLLSGLLAMGSRGTLQDEQSAWLKKRQACGADVGCLTSSYQERMKELDETYKRINRPI